MVTEEVDGVVSKIWIDAVRYSLEPALASGRGNAGSIPVKGQTSLGSTLTLLEEASQPTLFLFLLCLRLGIVGETNK